MIKRLSVLLPAIFLQLVGFSQSYKVHGKVVDRQLEPLALASVQIKDDKKGTVTDEQGQYELFLSPGKYDFIISMIGYETRIVTVLVNKDLEQNFILLVDEGAPMEPVIIKAKIKDRSEEVIRDVIKRKDAILAAPGAYSCDVYIKATREDSLSKKERKAVIKSMDNNDNLDDMAMAEILLQLDYESPTRYKEKRVGVAKRGERNDFFYLTISDGDFNLYNNLLKVPAVSQTPLISPVSYSGLIAYKYKTTKVEYFGKRRVYTISVKPKLMSNATVEGELVIDDSAKAILSARISFPSYHMPEYAFFEAEQQYGFVNDTAWMITRQKFTYYSKSKKGKVAGQTIVIYKDHELNKQFSSGYFGNELSITTKEAYQKDSSFWQQVRTEPLSDREVRFVQYQDSLYNLTHSEAYLDSLDAAMNKVTWKNVVLFGQTFNDHKKERRLMVSPLTETIQPFKFGGIRVNLSTRYTKTFPSRKNIDIISNLSYGFRNKDINGSLAFRKLYNPFSRGYYQISGGREFQFIFEGDAWINMLMRSNIYLNNFVGVGHEVELANGLVLYNDLEVAFRRSVSHYKINPKVDSLLGDILTNNQPVSFDPYNAFYNRIKLLYTPGQKYLREPNEKIILGSRFPSVYVEWIKGIPNVLESRIDFDYLEFGIQQKPKLGIFGNGAYRIRTGTYLNHKDLRVIDYKFQRRGDPIFFLDPHKTFQALDSSFPLFKRFYEGHYVHSFNGYFLNKVPLLKKLQLREVAGGGLLVAPERSLVYGELFAGLEREFKWSPNPLTKIKLGVYVVSSYANQFKNPVQFKVGMQTWDWLRDKWK